MADSESIDISSRSIDQLPVSAEVKTALKDIQAEVAGAYRDGFVEMVQAIRQQASALNRIQETLAILVRHLAPQLDGQIPPAVRVAGPDENPDLASTVVVADPIGSGYTLSQVDVAKALGIPATDASILIRAFKLSADGECAVVVRRGKKSEVVNYRAQVLDRFRQLITRPPTSLTGNERSALKRVRSRLGVKDTSAT